MVQILSFSFSPLQYRIISFIFFIISVLFLYFNTNIAFNPLIFYFYWVKYSIRGGVDMYEDEFSARLSYLRLQKGVSARDMSLSIGQNAGYINNIETGKALPSMSAFFYICEFLNISPKDFFDIESSCPEYLAELVNDLKKIDPEQIQHLSYIVKGLIQNHS